MARKPKEKTEPRGALVVDAGELIETMNEFNEADGDRASDAASDRSRIGEYLERTGINKKVFSHTRMVLRMKKPTDRADWLRSMETILPIIKAEIEKQSDMDFGAPADAKKVAAE